MNDHEMYEALITDFGLGPVPPTGQGRRSCEDAEMYLFIHSADFDSRLELLSDLKLPHRNVGWHRAHLLLRWEILTAKVPNGLGSRVLRDVEINSWPLHYTLYCFPFVFQACIYFYFDYTPVIRWHICCFTASSPCCRSLHIFKWTFSYNLITVSFERISQSLRVARLWFSCVPMYLNG